MDADDRIKSYRLCSARTGEGVQEIVQDICRVGLEKPPKPSDEGADKKRCWIVFCCGAISGSHGGHKDGYELSNP